MAHVRAAARNLDLEYAGALLRPYAYALPVIEREDPNGAAAGVLAAAREAGEQMVSRGGMDEEVLERVSRQLPPRSVLLERVNAQFKLDLDRAGIRDLIGEPPGP